MDQQNVGSKRSASSGSGRIASKSHEAGEQLKEAVVGQANQVRDQALSAKKHASERIRGVATQLQNVSSTLREDEPLIADLAARAGERIESVARYVSATNAQSFIQDTERVARQRPALFFGGAFILGLAAGRFLKSSSPGGALQLRDPQDDAIQVREDRSGPLVPREERQSGFFPAEGSTRSDQRFRENYDATFARDTSEPQNLGPSRATSAGRGDAS